MRGPSLNSSSSARAQRLRAGDVVRAVEQHERLAARRPRAGPATAPRANASATTSNGSGAPTKLSAAASAIAALSAWCAPCSGRNTSGYSAPRAAEVDEPAADREHVARARRSRRRARSTRAGVPRRRRSAWMLGIGLAEHERRAGLHDAGLLRRDLLARRPEVLDVVDAHVRDDRDPAVDDVRRVPRAAQPTSTTATSTASSANQRNAAAVTMSKYDGSTPTDCSTSDDRVAASRRARRRRSARRRSTCVR